MFSSVSWQEYLISVLLFLIVYYGYIIIVYFRKDLKSSRNVSTHTPANVSKDMFREDEDHALLFSLVHDLMGEIKQVFEISATKKLQTEELIMALQPIVKKYKKLKGTAFQVSVNNHIKKESEMISIPIEESDLKKMW